LNLNGLFDGKTLNANKMNEISVVICAYTEDRWDDLKASVQSVKDQTVQPLEIIVVIDHNKKLFERARSTFPEIAVIENQGVRGLSDARNSGISIARGEIIAFMDEDAVASPDWLSRLSAPYSDARVMGVGGLVAPYWIAQRPGWFPVEFNWVVGCSYLGLPEERSIVRNMIGCNMSLRRSSFDNVGGFRTGIGRVGTIPLGCEETELCIRVNQEISNSLFIHEPLASVSHRVPPQRGNVRYFLSRCYAEGISKALVTRLVGGQAGLSSERNYTFKVLPLGVLRGVRDAIFKFDLSGLGRATAIIAGFSFTVFGYIYGKLTLGQRISTNSNEANGVKINNGIGAK
jgi:glycosyltransferase involved in cell wall biosynthesis